MTVFWPIQRVDSYAPIAVHVSVWPLSGCLNYFFIPAGVRKKVPYEFSVGS